MGWARSRVLVIDEDLGHSTAGTQARPRFARLVLEVGLATSASCWASTCPGWPGPGGSGISCFQLGALSGALLGDLDRVDDPAVHNDRLLLGLKGTISKAELHLIKQWMWSGRMAKARRGELALPLPIGFVRRACGEVVLDPDEQVQALVRLVFAAFERLGTIGACWPFWSTTASSWACAAARGPGRG